MVKRARSSAWTKLFQRSLRAGHKVVGRAISQAVRRTVKQTVRQTLQPAVERGRPPPGAGDWLAGMAIGPAGARRFRLYRPPGVAVGERVPLMVMLHGCRQDAKGFAVSTRMNRVAARGRFLVLYPEQDRLANAQGCWNWFDTRAGRAQGEVALILNAIEQACTLYGADRDRIALVGLSAGASMAALLAVRHPARFKAVVMHSGIPPGSAHSTLTALQAMRGHARAAPTSEPMAADAVPWPPLLVIHGGADAVVSVDNGRAAAQLWADAAGARTVTPRHVQRGRRHAMQVSDFKQGRRTVASLVEVPRLGHAWSGGATTQPYTDAQGPDASAMAWAFAAKQFKA